MNNESFITLLIALVFVFGRCQHSKASWESRVLTRIDHGCDTFFHTKDINGKKEYRAAVDRHVLMMTRNSSTTELTVRMTDGQQLLRLHYAPGRHHSATAACELVSRQVTVDNFVLEFGFNRHNVGSICVSVDHILDEVGGRVLDPTQWNIDVGIDLRTLRDGVKQQCDPGNQKLAAFMQKLDEALSSVTEQQQRRHQERRSRTQRSVQVIMPGTRWCGTGNIAANGRDYGNIVATDRCCEQHDRCAHTIQSFSRKYGLFNYRFHTISHCECDDVFRSCLRAVGSEEANMVGRIFFNVVGTKCFILQVRRESECVERSWWGRCTREEMVNNEYAELKGPLSF